MKRAERFFFTERLASGNENGKKCGENLGKNEGQLNQIISDIIAQLALVDTQRERKNRCFGSCFTLPPDRGTGACTFLKVHDNLALVRAEISLFTPVVLSLPASDFAYLAYFQEVRCEPKDAKTLESDRLYANLGRVQKTEMVLPAGMSLRGAAILVNPKYSGFWGYGEGEKQIRARYARLDGLKNIEGVLPILEQIDPCPIENHPELARLYYKSKIQELITLFLNAAGIDLAPGLDRPRVLSPEDTEQIRNLMVHIRRHPESGEDVAELARMAQMSVSKLKYAFKAVSGEPLRDYRNSVRAKYACELLEQTDLPLWKISAQLGFSNPSGFSRFFREQIETSPYIYRRRFRQQRGRIPAGEEPVT